MHATMPLRKQGKQLAAKPSFSGAHATGLPKKRCRLSSSAANAAPREANGPTRKRFTKAEQKRFKRFQRHAKEVGLLVSHNAYELYFRDHLAD
jgi:hypothetical protein